MISVTITDRSGRTLSGQTLDAFWISIRARDARSASASTARSAPATCGRTSPSWRGIADCYVSCYPNAGLPNAFGEYDEPPDETGELLREFADQRLRQHRRRLLRHDAGSHRGHRGGRRRRGAAQSPGTDAAPRVPAEQRPDSRALAGLEPLTIRPDSNFLMIGERTNVTGSTRFARLIKTDNYDEAADGRASSRCAAAPTSSTSTWTKACSTPSRR